MDERWYPSARDLLLVPTKYDQANSTNATAAIFRTAMLKLFGCLLRCRMQNYADYDVVVLICGGIGVTPMASILSHNVNMFENSKCKCCGTVSMTSWHGASAVH